MTTRLTPYGSEQHARNVAKVGKEKTPRSLASRMPSLDIVAKVGKEPTTLSLVARMPSPEIAAKVGGPAQGIGARTHRVVRLSERG